METKTQNEDQGLYGRQLAENIQAALPLANAVYDSGNIYLSLPTTIGEKANLKGWLCMLLDTLPVIVYPPERLQVVIYEKNEIRLLTVINPSGVDVRA